MDDTFARLLKQYNDLVERYEEERTTYASHKQRADDEARRELAALRAFLDKSCPSIDQTMSKLASTYLPQLRRDERGYWLYNGSEGKLMRYESLAGVRAWRDRLVAAVQAFLTSRKFDANICSYCNSIKALDRDFDRLQREAPTRRQGAGSGTARRELDGFLSEHPDWARQVASARREGIDTSFVGSIGSVPTHFDEYPVLTLASGTVRVRPYGAVPATDISTTDTWSLAEDGIVVVHATPEQLGDEALVGFAERVIGQFITAYPAGAVQLSLCDNSTAAPMVSLAGVLSRHAPKLLRNASGGVGVHITTDAMAGELRELRALIDRRVAAYAGAYGDVLAYNAAHPDTAQPLVLCVLYGSVATLFDRYDYVGGALSTGRKAGVYFLVVDTDDDKARLPVDWRGYDAREYTFDEPNLLVRSGCGLSALCYYEGAFADLLDRVGDKLQPKQSAIPMTDVYTKAAVDADSRRRTYLDELSIPFGKSEGKVCDIALSANKPTAHVLVTGTTGSGKSVFLNTLILSAAWAYSPDELEISLFGPVKAHFEVYRDYGLPHLKAFFVGQNFFYAESILGLLQKEMNERYRKKGGKSLEEYNRMVPRDQRIKRALIVIDEFQNLLYTGESRDILSSIARQGRECGISLVLATQDLPLHFDETSQFGNRVEFANNERFGEIIKSVRSRAAELSVAPGTCFVESEGVVRLARVAYPGKEEAEVGAEIERIAARYPHHKMNLRTDADTGQIDCHEDVPYLCDALRAYEEQLEVPVRLGKTFFAAEPVEYRLGGRNNKLILVGDYAATKEIEASIIKDALYLGKDYPESVIYLDLGTANVRNARRNTVVKRMMGAWRDTGRVAYYANPQWAAAIAHVKDIVRERVEDENAPLNPIVLVVTECERLRQTYETVTDEGDFINLKDELNHLAETGGDMGISFVFQFGQLSSDSGYQFPFATNGSVVEDAVLVPASADGDAVADVREALYSVQAGTVEAGKAMMDALAAGALPEGVVLLCDNLRLKCVVPYRFSDAFYADILHKLG